MFVTNCKSQYIFISLIVGAVMVAAFFFLMQQNQAALPSGVTQYQIDSALDDLSQATGQDIATQDQAAAICNKEQFFTVCAEIGQKHNLFAQEEIQQVKTLLDEIKSTIAEELKSCQSIECLINIANKLATSISSNHPELALQVDLTPKLVKEKEEIVIVSKEIGVDFKVCEDMNPETAPIDVLRKCAKLARDSRIKKYVPLAIRDQIDQVGDYVDGSVNLREALAFGRYQCGDNTVEGCGNYCLNPSPDTVAQGVSNIPQVCRQIAADIFGPDGVKQLESRHQQLGQTIDFNYKKARNMVFTTLDGRTISDPAEIGRYMEEQGRRGNVDAVVKGMDFMVANGFATPEDRDFAVKMISRFKEKGQTVDFDACTKDFRACEDFIPEDFRDNFGTMDEVFNIMSQEIGFNPDLCQRGEFDESVGLKCLEGSKRALPRLEVLAAKNPQVQFIVDDIKRHVARGDDLVRQKDQFKGGEFSGPGGCKSEQECRTYCSNPTNGPECIAFGAKHEIEGFKDEEAVVRLQEFQYNVRQGPNWSQPFPVPGNFPGQGPYPGFPPPPSFTSPSPECFAAIQAGDFVRAKEVCSNFVPPPPGPPPFCPDRFYEPCPEGYYRKGHVNQDGCFVEDGECRQATVCPSSPPPPQCQTNQYPRPKFDDNGCLIANECVNVGVYPTPPYPPPTYSPFPTSSSSGDPSADCRRVGGFWNDSIKSCQFPDPIYSPGPTVTGGAGGMYKCFYPSATINGRSPGYTVWCEKDYFNCHEGSPSGNSISLDGLSLGAPSYCESGYAGCNYNKFCDYSESLTSCPSDCSTGPTYSPYPSPTNTCPTGYHYHGESGGFCMNSQENYAGTCYDSSGQRQIACPQQPTYSPYPTSSPTSSGTCPSGSHIMYVNNAGGYCMSDADLLKCGPMNSTSVSSFGSCTSYQSTTTYTPSPSCPSGQWWDPAINACKTTTPYDTPPPVPSCPSGQWWDYGRNSCVSSTTTYTPPPSCPSNQWWDYATNSCKSSTYTYTPAPTCPSDQWWDYATSTCKTTSSSGFCGNNYCESYETASSCPSDCGGGTSYTPYPTTQYTPPPSCPSGQWWDYSTNSCKVSSTTEYTPYPTTEYTPPPSSPVPTYSEPPPPTSSLYNHYIVAHCQQLGRRWDGSFCQANGLFARFYENYVATILQAFSLLP